MKAAPYIFVKFIMAMHILNVSSDTSPVIERTKDPTGPAVSLIRMCVKVAVIIALCMGPGQPYLIDSQKLTLGGKNNPHEPMRAPVKIGPKNATPSYLLAAIAELARNVKFMIECVHYHPGHKHTYENIIISIGHWLGSD